VLGKNQETAFRQRSRISYEPSGRSRNLERNRNPLNTSGTGFNIAAEIIVDHVTPATNISYYTWGLDLSGSLQGAGGVGGLLSDTKVSSTDTNVFYSVSDANGNVTEYIDENGTVEADYEYSATGVETYKSGSMKDDFTYRFSTKPFDSEMGLVAYELRYLKPDFSWLSRDPIGEKGGKNLYVIGGNDLSNNWDYLGMYPDLVVPPELFFPPEPPTEQEIKSHFLKLKNNLKKELKAMCPKSSTGWTRDEGNKEYCCKPKACKEDAEKMADVYIKALEHAFRLRKYPGGGWGNFLSVCNDGWGAGQFYNEVEGGGLTCGGWSEMGEVVLSPITEKSDCWVYNTEKSKLKIRWKGVDYPAHQWSSLRVMKGKKAHLDPWGSGGWWY
jgi:RHS repeat-associated protein